ncbi:MAG: spore maturation protein A [Clostridiales bacterium]|nr:spore maturation protein A [Clostridiales bacterium]
MAFIWLIMLVSSLGLMLFTNPAAAVNSMIDGAHGAVELSLNLLALYAFWLGFFALIERLGLSRGLERLLRPVISRLFPSCDTETRKYITMNVSANLLGLGNAATPMAITAINRMDNGSAKASTDMIMLTVISATSLQILPTTVIGMRATAGSINPADFLFPSLVATVLSTLIGIIGVKLCSKIFDRPRKNKEVELSESAPLGNITPSRTPRHRHAQKSEKPSKSLRRSKKRSAQGESR